MASNRKKIMAIMIALLMTASVFASCNNTTDNGQTTQTTTTGSTASGEPGDNPIEETPKILPKLDDADFGGYNFKILTRTSTNPDWIDWIPRDVAAEEETGDPINDAVYKRNRYLEGLYNFTVTQVFSENISGDIRRAVGAGDNSFDAAQPGNLRDTPAIAQSGNLVNLHNVPNLDLEQPWWDPGAVNNLSILGRLFFTSGDIVLVNRDACPGILFNKMLLQQLQLENPYELVLNNKWTIQKLYDMARDAASDLDGDQNMSWQTDRYGFIGQRDTQIAIFHGSGELIASKDDNDMPIITFGSERAYAAMEGCYQIMYDQTFTFNLHHLENLAPGTAIYPVSEQMFMENRGLFMWVRLRIVQNLRSMETDFGILPMPKLEEHQEVWGHTVNSFTGSSIAIPNVHDEESLARAGHILEALAAESKYTVIPAYYDTQLKTKIARDNESSDMFDIIFSSTVWDIGEIYNWGDLSGRLIYMSMDNDRNIASLFERIRPTMENGISRVVRAYEALD